MYALEMLGIDEALKAINAMLAEAKKNPQRPMAFCIVDQNCELVAFARMDRCRRLVEDAARRKAYTAARMGQTSRAWGDSVKNRNLGVADFGNPQLLGFPGGVPILVNGQVVGAVGTSGRAVEEDEAIATLGVKSITG